MLDGAALTAILITLGLFAASLFFTENRRPNLLTFAMTVFLLYILPKLILLTMDETAVLLPSAAALDRQSINAATLLITSFMSALAVAYILVAAFSRKAEPTEPLRVCYDATALRTVSVIVIMPLYLLMLFIYVDYADVTLINLFSKPELIVDGNITIAYVLQKFSQIIKCGFYLMLLQLLSGSRRPEKDLRWIAVFLLCTSLVYLVSGARSGILILMIEALLTMRIAGVLRWKFVLVLAGLFVAANVVILSERLEDANIALMNVVFRRYFMDVEKIAGILEYAILDPAWRFNPVAVFLTVSDANVPDYNIHFFVAERIFGIGGGVPPSVLGEIILYFGPVFLLPLTLIGGILIANAERLCLRLRHPALQLALVSVLSKVYWLWLNSDTVSLVRGSIFDLGLLLLALGFYESYRLLMGPRPQRG